MDYSSLASLLQSQIPDLEIHLRHPLAPYTTLKIGGPADLFLHPKTTNHFISILNLIYQNPSPNDKSNPVDEVNNFSARSERESATADEPEGSEHRKNSLTSQPGFPVTILGHGSNVLISDTGIRGLVIKNDSADIDFTNAPLVKVSSGTPLNYLINQTLDHGLLGLEEFAYIPGTIGGAIAGNIHGVNNHHFSDFITSVTMYGSTDVSTPSSVSTPPVASNPPAISLCATLKLIPGDPAAAKTKVKTIIAAKSAIQPLNSAGCVFVNPEDSLPPAALDQLAQKAGLPAVALAKAGKLLDDLGWKGRSVGGAQVSPLHANFIVNQNHATATDFYTLITQIQADVLAKTGISLVPEIRLLGDFPSP